MNKLYSKPELEVEAFDVEDVITASTITKPIENDYGELSAGMEFNIAAGSDEF